MIKCITIDDEPLALEVLESHISKIDDLQLEGSFTNPLKAFSFIRDNDIDLIFLDIQMPELSGLDLIKLISKDQHVILTTAYKEYAVEGYELDVTDYLLKPILFERFFKSFNKVLKYIELENSQQVIDLTQENVLKESGEDFIFVNSDNKTIKVNFDQIYYIEAWRDYVKIVAKDEVILSLLSISSMERQLITGAFTRVHRSFIINKTYIEVIERNRIYMNGNWIPVGGSYRANFQNWLTKHKIS